MHRRMWVPVAAIVLLIMLAAGLSQVSFVRKRFELPPEASSPDRLTHPQEAPLLSPLNPPWWTDLILIAAGTLLLASVIFLIFNPKDLKEVLQRAATLSLWVIAIYLIIKKLREMNAIPVSKEVPGTDAPTLGGPLEALPSFEQFQPPTWITFFFISAILVAAGLLIFLLWRWGRHRLLRERGPLAEELALLSRHAVENLRAGAGLSETIMRCYHEMCELMSKHARVSIDRAMTVREFERELAEAGIQGTHIERLSRLFEWARYSDKKPTPTQEQEAITALEVIARLYGRTT